MRKEQLRRPTAAARDSSSALKPDVGGGLLTAASAAAVACGVEMNDDPLGRGFEIPEDTGAEPIWKADGGWKDLDSLFEPERARGPRYDELMGVGSGEASIGGGESPVVLESEFPSVDGGVSAGFMDTRIEAASRSCTC